MALKTYRVTKVMEVIADSAENAPIVAANGLISIDGKAGIIGGDVFDWSDSKVEEITPAELPAVTTLDNLNRDLCPPYQVRDCMDYVVLAELTAHHVSAGHAALARVMATATVRTCRIELNACGYFPTAFKSDDTAEVANG